MEWKGTEYRSPNRAFLARGRSWKHLKTPIIPFSRRTRPRPSNWPKWFVGMSKSSTLWEGNMSRTNRTAINKKWVFRTNFWQMRNRMKAFRTSCFRSRPNWSLFPANWPTKPNPSISCKKHSALFSKTSPPYKSNQKGSNSRWSRYLLQSSHNLCLCKCIRGICKVAKRYSSLSSCMKPSK